ncbi:MAG: hypothetical protein KC777_26235, partial [Cyanobacteria bacterium HKST-UBA02]|nr:hypothetical protein [Cyanobacteria bacterium HKST-UBA02]
YGTANNRNQYPTVGGVSQTYDSNGCLTSDGTWTFGYDVQSHLISASKTGVSASYLYDPIHRQGQKTVGSTKTRYIYNGEQRIADYDGTSGSLLDRYVFGVGLDEPLIKVSSGGTITYFHHDRVGSIVAISDNSGAVTNTYAYSPWGESASLSGTSFGFTGQRYDAETELYFFKSRHYSPAIGRFLQPDPIGYVGGLNLYAYVNNDPLGFVDPMGFKGSPIPGGVSDGGGGGPIGFGPLYSSSPYWAQFDQLIGLVLNAASFFYSDWLSYLATVHSHQENILKAGEVIADRYGGKILGSGSVVLNVHGNSNTSTKPNILYAIVNTTQNIVLRYGQTGSKVSKAGRPYRVGTQIKKFEKQFPGDTISWWKLDEASGNSAAGLIKSIERDVIVEHRTDFGRRPPFNLADH